jgi:ArsR family transcriptional regulator
LTIIAAFGYITISGYIDIVMEAITYFKALADETRLRVLNLLYKKELNVNEIVSILSMGQSRISRHLKILSDSSLIISRKDGLWVFYKANDSSFSGDLIRLIDSKVKNEEIFLLDIFRLENYIKESGEKGKEYFNKVASDWKKIRGEILGDLNLNSEIVKFAGKCRCTADLGCGNGELVELLLAKSEKVIGVDRSSGMLDEAGKYLKSSGETGFDLRLGELAHLPIRDSETDCAVINMVLHYLDDPSAAVAEARRVIKSGGRLLITELDSHGDESLRNNYGHRWLGFPRDTVKSWLDGNGFLFKKSKSFRAAKGLSVVLYVAEKV